MFYVFECIIQVLSRANIISRSNIISFSSSSLPALHLAVMQGRLNNVRTLLTESNIDAEAFNLRYGSFKLIAAAHLLDRMWKIRNGKISHTVRHVDFSVCVLSP